MKKKILLALAAVTALSSLKVMALTDEEEAYRENVEGKITAIQELQKEVQAEEQEYLEGKISATELNNMIYDIEDLSSELQLLITSMGEAGEGLQANSLGQYDSLVQALVDKVHAEPNSQKVVAQSHKEAMAIKAELKTIVGQ